MFNDRNNLSRRRFLSNFAFASTAIATGVGSWVVRPDWANAASDPIKVGIATDLTGPIGYAGNADAQCRKDGDQGNQRRRRVAWPAAGAVHRGHRVESNRSRSATFAS